MKEVKKARKSKKPYDIMKDLQDESKKAIAKQEEDTDKILKQIKDIKNRREELLIYREKLWKELDMVNAKLIGYDMRIEKKMSQLVSNNNS